MSTIPLSTAGGSIDSLPGLQATPFIPIALSDFRSRVLNLYEPPLMSRSSFLNMRRALDLVGELLGADATTADLTMAAIAAFVKSRHGLENPNTTRTWLSRISAACNIGVAEGVLRFNPVKIRRRWVRSVTPKVPRIHSREEIARVLTLAAAEAEELTGWEGWRARRLHALASLVAYTGIRRNEALTLQIPDVDLARRMIFLTARVENELKTPGAATPVPIPVDLVPVLERWIADLRNPIPAGLPGRRHFHRYLNGGNWDRASEEWVFPNSFRSGPWTGGSTKHRACDCLQRLARRAGIPGFTFASLRHSWSTHAEHWGLTDVQIARVLRHTNTQTQKIYRHAEQENLRAMVAPVSYGLAVSTPPPAAAVDPLPPVVRGDRKHLTLEQRAELLELRKQGWSSADLQARYGCSSATISRTKKRAGQGVGDAPAGAPPAQRQKWAPLTFEQAAELVALKNLGWTAPALCEKFNCSRATVFNARARMKRIEAAATSAGEQQS